jgi:hypothetical protein
MNLRSLISKFVAQICEKKYSEADNTLDSVVTQKVKNRIQKTAENQEPKKNNKATKKKVAKKATRKTK